METFKTYNERTLSTKHLDVSKYATVTAQTAAPTVSKKYRFIPTTRPLEVLADYGWHPVKVTEARTRVSEKEGYQRHIIRLVNDEHTRNLSIGETVPQIVLSNDHSGGGAFEFLIGLFEKICSNGLCVSSGDAGRLRVLHRGYDDPHVERFILQMLQELPAALRTVEKAQSIYLEHGQRLDFTQKALELRWDGNAYSINPTEALYARRIGQRSPTLWNTYNVVQEAVIRGGIRQTNSLGSRTRARAITSPKEDLRLNRGLWELMAQEAQRH
jgi:hypothetical protein